jgi:cytochrome c biogenesis factor
MTEPRSRIMLRPGELVGLAALVAVFVGLITLMVTRELTLSLIVFGATFVLDLVTLAMLMLAVTPNKPADGERAPETKND